jgi:hypothetical protein
MGNRTRGLPACIIVPEPTTLPRALKLNIPTTDTMPIIQSTVVIICTTCINIGKLRIWPTERIYVFRVFLTTHMSGDAAVFTVK